MLLLLALTLPGHADPDRVLARRGEALTERTWWTVEDLASGPARPRWRNRRGTWTCATFPDGVALRCRQHDKATRAVLADWRFDASGRPITTVHYEDGERARIEVHGIDAVEIPIAEPSHTDIGPVRVYAPSSWQVDPNGRGQATLPTGKLSVQVLQDDQDVLDDAFGEALERGCGCVVEDRAAAWLMDHAGVRYRLRFPDPEQPSLSELWAVPLGERQVLLAVFSTPASGSLQEIQARLAHGRAWLALAEPEPASPEGDRP